MLAINIDSKRGPASGGSTAKGCPIALAVCFKAEFSA
jgi:hypothetical protein